MRSFARDRIRAEDSEFKSRASDEAYDSEPPSPANCLARLGVLILVALCFGLVAQFLVGAP
jgi:hypothetical protein